LQFLSVCLYCTVWQYHSHVYASNQQALHTYPTVLLYTYVLSLLLCASSSYDGKIFTVISVCSYNWYVSLYLQSCGVSFTSIIIVKIARQLCLMFVGQLYLYVGYPIVIHKLQWRNKSRQQQVCL